MYVILFYDISKNEQKDKKNANRIRKAVEKFLPRVQFSVYEGEIRQSDFTKMLSFLQKECIQEYDSVVIYTFASQKYTKRLVIGLDKNEPLFS